MKKSHTFIPSFMIMLLIVWVGGCFGKTEPAKTESYTPSLPPRLDGVIEDEKVTFDDRVRQYIVPKRIVWQSPASDGMIRNAESLLVKRTGQVTLDAHNGFSIQTKDKPAGIVLDFGAELHGGVQLMVWKTTGNQPVRLRVRFGESVSETMADVHGEKNATNDHAVRDQTCLVPWLGTHEIGNTGFRFVRIDLVDTNAMVEFKSIRAVFIYRDIEYKGSFECDDERLNTIWQTGAYTVHLNMQDYLWDGIKRDRLVWIGDMHPETMTIGSVFGYHSIVPASLDLIREETPGSRWMNGISSYSMWWILIHHSWYIQNGDLDYLKEQKGYLTGLLRDLSRYIGDDNQETLPEMRFLDWPSSENKTAIHAGLHSLLILTMEAGENICQAIGDVETESLCKKTAARLRKHVPDHGNSKQAAALMTLAGLGDAKTLNREVMAVGGGKNMSTFYGYYVLQGRAMAGDYQGAMDCIKEYWGAMLDVGATTFWEDFNLEWLDNAGRIDEIVPDGKKDIHGDYGNYCYQGFRHSLCHGWASGPTAWLTEHVLGVKPLEPGCKVVLVEPHLGNLKWVKGTYPTPYGIIRVSHVKAANGKVVSTIDAPEGVEIVRTR